MAVEINPVAVWRRNGGTTLPLEETLGGSTNPYGRGGPFSTAVCAKRLGTNPHPNVGLARAIYEVQRGIITSSPTRS